MPRFHSIFNQQRGIVTPLFAFGLIIMLALLLFILALDSIILTRSAHELRIRLDQACEYAARDAVIEQRAYESGGLDKYLDTTIGSYTLNNLHGELFIPVIPPPFTPPAGVNPNNLPPETHCGVPSYCNFGYNTATTANNCVCSTEFGDFTSANVHQSFDAGSYTGCRASATVKRFFLSESTITATTAFWSIPYGLAPLGEAGIGGNFPTISVAIAPQVRAFDFEVSPASGDQFAPLLLNAGDSYINNIAANSSSTYYDGLLAELSGVTGRLAEPAYTLPGNIYDENDRRAQLYTHCVHPAILLRQRLSTALLELLARNGLTRSRTQLLSVNPKGDSPTLITPPTIVAAVGDINSEASSIPLVQTSLLYTGGWGGSDVVHHIMPFYPDSCLNTGVGGGSFNPSCAASRDRYEYEAMAARMPGLCYHLDDQDRMRALSGSPSFDNSNYENSADYGWADRLWGNSYDSMLNVNSVYMDHLGRSLASLAPYQRNLKPAEITSVLGGSSRCLFETTTGPPCMRTAGVLPTFEPDLRGLLRFWRGAIGPYQNSPELGLLGSRGQDSNHAMALFLHEVGSSIGDVNQTETTVDSTTLIPSVGPITIIYVPTNETDADWSNVDIIAERFDTNMCAPNYQPQGKRSNTLIPIVPSSYAPAGSAEEECLLAMSPCFAQTNLQDLWDCLLSGRAAEDFTLSQIYQTNLMRPVRRL